MTNEQVTRLFQKYEDYFAQPPSRVDTSRLVSDLTTPEISAHLKWMCLEGKKMVAAGETEKAMRWLGFIQGSLWTSFGASIDDLRDDNR